MKKIYILTEGSYSDFHIVGVAEDKETAEMLSEKWGCEIKEFCINTIRDAKYIQNKILYKVTMWKNGNSEVKQDSDQEADVYPKPNIRFWGGLYVGKEMIVDFRCWADSPEHAVKIANEYRIGCISSGAWDSEENRLKSEQEEYFEQEMKRLHNRIVVMEGDKCTHRSLLASKPILNEAFYHKNGELYKLYRCQFCYEVIKEEKVN